MSKLNGRDALADMADKWQRALAELRLKQFMQSLWKHYPLRPFLMGSTYLVPPAMFGGGRG